MTAGFEVLTVRSHSSYIGLEPGEQLGIDIKSAWCFLVGVSSNRGILIGLGGLGLGAGLLRAN